MNEHGESVLSYENVLYSGVLIVVCFHWVCKPIVDVKYVHFNSLRMN